MAFLNTIKTTITLLICGGFLHGQVSRLDSIDFSTFEDSSKLSGHILYTEDSQIISAKDFGAPNLFIPSEWSDDIGFNIGSLTSIYTYQILDALFEEEILDKNDPINRYMLEYPLETTIEKLYNHEVLFPESYIVGFHRSVYRNSGRRDSLIEMQDIFDWINQSDEVQEIDSSLYSNIGMMMLTRIMEVATGKSYFQLVNEYLPGYVQTRETLNTSIGHYYNNFSQETVVMNSLQNMGMPYDDDTYGHQGLFVPVNKIVRDYLNSNHRNLIPLISGAPGYHIEIIELDENRRLFILLNQIGDSESIEKRLKSFLLDRL